MDLKLSFIGITANDFDASFRFYTETLGMNTRDWRPGWALFDTTGMVFELFGDGSHSGAKDQMVEPVLHVADAEIVAHKLHQNGVMVTARLDGRKSGPYLDFAAADHLIWLLQSEPGSPVSLSRPHIGAVEVKTERDRFEDTRQFYEHVMGMNLAESHEHDALLVQEEGEPVLILVAGGMTRPRITDRRQAPHFLSFQTQDIEAA